MREIKCEDIIETVKKLFYTKINNDMIFNEN